MHRRAPALLVLLALAGVASAAGGSAGERPAAGRAAVQAPVPSAFFISGRGWGHGVGLSQWGAYGFAQRGVGYRRILGHYYRGTALGSAPISRVRVLLAEGHKSVSVGSNGPIRVRDGAGALHTLAAGSHTFGPGLKLKVAPDAPRKALPGPLLFTGASDALRFGERPYRGQLRIDVVSGGLRVINHVGLEAYLYGVVPREVPFTWPAEALKAQAVVARSYALAVRKAGPFDLYPDVRSQVYGGIEAEKPSTTAATTATAGEVLLYAGKVATTFFFSTSGGRTASVEDAWNGSPIPYLVSVPDPYDTASPHHSWGPFAFTAAKLAKVFNVPGRLLDLQTVVNTSRRVEHVIAIGSGGRVTVPGSDVRRLLGLRSTWFRIGLLTLEAPAAPITYGSSARLVGYSRGSSVVTLEQRVSGGVWEPAARLKAKAGRVTAVVKPLVSTSYRLAASSTLFGQPVEVVVAPLVRFRQVTERTALRGLVRPVLPGAQVELQRLRGSSWRVVGRAEVDAAGNFEVRLELAPGSYRARVTAGRGFAPGVSPVLKVVG
jgi:stage II sporulation protein D